MRYDQFLATVTDRGKYHTQEEAERVTLAVLGLLGRRLTEGEAKDLAAQLPAALADVLSEAGPTETFGVEEFCRRLAAEVNGTEETARWDASAVLSTVADAVSGGQLNQVLSQLPARYAELFGKPDLT